MHIWRSVSLLKAGSACIIVRFLRPYSCVIIFYAT